LGVTEAAGDDAGRWRAFGERVIYESPEIWLGEVDVGLPDGERIWRHVVRLHRSAAVVLTDGQDRVLVAVAAQVRAGQVGLGAAGRPGG